MKKDKTVRKAERKAALKKMLKSLIAPGVFVLLVLAGIGIFAILGRDTEEPEEIIQVNGYDGEEKAYILENDKLIFSLDSSTTQFTVTMKETGQVWYSNPVDASEDALAMTIEKDKLQSTLLLTYSTINGVDTLYSNYSYSMQNQIYQIEESDDSIKVYYSIGNVEQEYVIPLVMEEERMQAVFDKVDKSDMVMITDYYKKYDINNLGRNDDREALLAQYPILETNVIYTLRSTTKDNIKRRLEEIFSSAGYTYEEYLEDKEKDLSESVSDNPVFNISIIYRLDGDDLIVEIPYDEIQYREEYPIYYLTVLPYFGAGGTQEDGFLLVPEGGGSVIRFNNGRVAQNSYYANVYGWDMAQDRDAVVHETRTYFNVFGVAKEDSSFLCILEEGAPYAAIQADISGRNNSYNYVNAVYNLVHREQYDVSDRYNGNMFVYESGLPAGESLVQRYCFVDSGDYSDMAAAYRDYLLNRYGDYLIARQDSKVPVAVEILGAVDKVKQILGVPVQRPLELTTFAEAQEMLEEMIGDGMTNLSVKLSGWMNGGVQQKILKDVNLVNDLGSERELKELIGVAEANNIPFYLDGITSYAYDSSILNGFFVFTDAARFVSKERAELSKYSTVIYGKQEEEDSYYLLTAGLIEDMIGNLADTAAEYQAGISFQEIGRDLSSDFSEDNPVSRQQALERQAASIRAVHDEGIPIMMNMGNDYVAAYSEIITNMDLGGSEYTIIDYQVPFYQMALHGYVNYTGEALNLAQDFTDELLKSAEYGAGLMFTFMKENAFTLQNTLYYEYFGADYDAWYDRMLETYTRYNEELGHVFSQRMTAHEYEQANLACTMYEDGTRVYVNYSYSDMTAKDGTLVPARDYAVVR